MAAGCCSFPSQVVVEARFARKQRVPVGAPAGERHDHQFFHAGGLAQRVRHLVAVHAGQADVQEHDIGQELLRRAHRLVAIAGHPGGMPGDLQQE